MKDRAVLYGTVLARRAGGAKKENDVFSSFYKTTNQRLDVVTVTFADDVTANEGAVCTRTQSTIMWGHVCPE